MVTEIQAFPIGGVISTAYKASIAVVGVCVFIVFLLAGLSYIIPEKFRPSFMSNPVQMMQDAVIGTIILFSAYLILNTINPELVKMK